MRSSTPLKIKPNKQITITNTQNMRYLSFSQQFLHLACVGETLDDLQGVSVVPALALCIAFFSLVRRRETGHRLVKPCIA